MYSRDDADWIEYKIFINIHQSKPYLKFISKNYLSNRVTFFLKFLMQKVRKYLYTFYIENGIKR